MGNIQNSRLFALTAPTAANGIDHQSFNSSVSNSEKTIHQELYYAIYTFYSNGLTILNWFSSTVSQYYSPRIM